MSQEIQIPASFQNQRMAKAFQGKVSLDDSLADGIGQSYPIIAYKGKIWALRHRGERKIVTRPDDGSPSGHLDVIILQQGKGKAKSFYKAYDPSTSEGERPICASIDGIVPDADVQLKQAESCALCPRNVWKTDPDSGRKGRECSDYKRLAVLVMPTQSAAVFGQPLMEPMFLRVPPDSLQSLARMGETMTAQGYHYSTYLTRITFDPLKAHPSMVFRPVQPLSDAEAEVVIELQNSPQAGRITGGDPAQQGIKMIEQAAPNTSWVPPAAVTAPVTERPNAGLSSMPPKPAQQQVDAVVAVVNTGLGKPVPKNAEAPKKPRAKPAPVQEAAPALAPQSNGQQADTGVSEPSDDELDAEIAKLITR